MTLLVGAGLASGACRRQPAVEAVSPETVPVTVDAARVGTVRDTVTATGTITPSPAGDLTIYASEPGTIVELPKKEQDAVAIGDLLVRLEIPSVTQDLATAQLALVDAQARADRAHAELTRQTSLFERGITPRTAIENARADASAADGALAQARTHQDTLQGGPDRTTVKAHFAGTVAKVWHGVGDAVRPGSDDPILRLVDGSRVQISAQVPIAQLGRVAPGQSATIQALGDFQPEAAQVIAKIGSQDPSALTGEVRLTFLKPAALPIDTPVTATIDIDQRTGAIMVASGAVRRDPQGTFVMVAGDDLRAHRRDVRLGLVTKDFVQVTAGIAAGERVIVSSIGDIVEGSAVTLAH